MTRRFSRTLLAVSAVSTLSLTALAAPAGAEDASGGSYASSVATVTHVNIANLPGSAIQFRASVSSTSSSVTNLDGTVTLEFRRNRTGGLAARRVVKYSETSGTIVTKFVDLPDTIPAGSFTVTGFFNPDTNQIEKASVGRRGVSYNPN